VNTPGYSGKPLHEKLGFKVGDKIATISAPADYKSLLSDAPPELKITTAVGKDMDAIHVFATDRSVLAKKIAQAHRSIHPDGMIWVSWPKQTSKVPTNITEDVVREIALPTGLVDVKVCAVSDVWSGLKLVIRKAMR
jgi:hypothetical protein